MSTAIEPRRPPSEGEHRFLLRGVSWKGYEALLDMIGNRATRVTYHRGDAELMLTHYAHERCRVLIGRMVETVTEELNIPAVGAGSTTFKSERLDCGLEPARSYYLANVRRLRKVVQLDLSIDPPPDLAIEVELSACALNRLDIYAALGVPEVWRYDGEGLTIHLRSAGGTYRLSESSAAFPVLPMSEVLRRLHDCDHNDDTRWSRAFRVWVRDEIVSRVDG